MGQLFHFNINLLRLVTIEIQIRLLEAELATTDSNSNKPLWFSQVYWNSIFTAICIATVVQCVPEITHL